MAESELKENRRIHYTKTVLKDSLLELMRTQSILNISVKALCNKANVSRSTFYTYYKNQYALLKQIEDETLSSVEDMLKEYDDKLIMHDGIPVFEGILGYIAENGNSIQILLSENGDINFQKRFFRRFTDTRKMMKYFADRIEDTEEAEYHLVFAVSGATALVQHWLKNNMSIPIPELAALLVKLTK